VKSESADTGSVSRSTHREILRVTATNLDPLGCLAPVLIVAKLILQNICKAKIEWDVPLDKELADKAAMGRLPRAGLDHRGKNLPR
jgi:hypothetical protein